jgi:hypothetical protein
VRIGEAVADLNPGAAFSCGGSAMNYQAFTSGALDVHDTVQ